MQELFPLAHPAGFEPANPIVTELIPPSFRLHMPRKGWGICRHAPRVDGATVQARIGEPLRAVRHGAGQLCAVRRFTARILRYHGFSKDSNAEVNDFRQAFQIISNPDFRDPPRLFSGTQEGWRGRAGILLPRLWRERHFFRYPSVTGQRRRQIQPRPPPEP